MIEKPFKDIYFNIYGLNRCCPGLASKLRWGGMFDGHVNKTILIC